MDQHALRIQERFQDIAPQVDFCSLRLVQERASFLSVRQNIVQPVTTSHDLGVMITVVDGGGLGYAGTSDLTEDGLRRTAEQALGWARQSARHSVLDFSTAHLPHPRGTYQTPVAIAWESVPLGEKIDLLRAASQGLKTDDRIVDWDASLWYAENETVYLTTDRSGSHTGRCQQRIHHIVPMLSATANAGSDTQTRTFGGRGYCRQGGLEVLDLTGFRQAPAQIATEALQLLDAPNCPEGTMDVLLGPDQMILQIHESIGHPLELDRILGDERNYAGTSFVTPDMFDSYQYGSELLNISFDPTRPEEFGSYRFDDDGAPAKRAYLIENGILKRGLGGTISQARTGLPGVANSRATSWNRAPIDRMANLNLEPGTSSFGDMLAAIEHGVYMQTNTSWSIDDSRNKFQFGCEWGQLIENGKLTTIVKNPNYRGVSATFWRNLKMVGNPDTFQVLGTPYCGKGEPNQVIRVGHASPPCVFSEVEVFGGAQEEPIG